MKFFSAALQGSVLFVTLLVGQVVIVTSLALTALWLYFKRLQQRESEGAEELPKVQENSAGVSQEFLSELQQKLVNLEKEKEAYLVSGSPKLLEDEKMKTEELQKLNQEASEKIKTLEMRISEYQILGQEIAQVTEYKKEIEKLKSELEAVQKQNLDTSIKIEENKVASTDSNKVVELKQTIENPPDVSANTEGSRAISTGNEDPGLEGLLNEIEALTADKKNTMKKTA